MASSVLVGSERAEEAVRNCFAAASQDSLAFKSESAFHCWLIRILIDEALLILDSGQDLPATPPRTLLARALNHMCARAFNRKTPEGEMNIVYPAATMPAWIDAGSSIFCSI